MSKPYTNEEIRNRFLNHLKMMINYWDTIPNITSKEKLEGFTHSLLVLIDGGTNTCGFQMIPSVHIDDREYCIKNDEDYYPYVEQSEYDIREDVQLHELMYKKD